MKRQYLLLVLMSLSLGVLGCPAKQSHNGTFKSIEGIGDIGAGSEVAANFRWNVGVGTGNATLDIFNKEGNLSRHLTFSFKTNQLQIISSDSSTTIYKLSIIPNEEPMLKAEMTVTETNFTKETYTTVERFQKVSSKLELLREVISREMQYQLSGEFTGKYTESVSIESKSQPPSRSRTWRHGDGIPSNPSRQKPYH